MKNFKFSIGALALVSLTVLASCQPVTEKTGVVLTLTGNSEPIEYTADDLFDRYSGNATGVARYYEAAIEIVIRNEMTLEENASVLAEIMTKAENRVEGVKESARSAAETNRTSYDSELETKLNSFNVENLEELKDYFAYQLMKEEVEDQFYKNNKTELLVGAEDYVGYLDTRLPYHVKHILVNVSASSNTFYNGEISEADARKLTSVVRRLATQQSGESFGDIAEEQSDDPVSASNFGDLGIMSLSTSFVNEFKLGVYAYETMFNTVTDNQAAKLNVPQEAYDLIQSEPLGLGEIPYGAFLELENVADVSKDTQGNQVNNGSPLYFPRNIYFNRYINLRNISVIVPEDLDGNELTPGDGFNAVPELNNKVVLTDEVGRPILAVRGGSGSGGGGYQGIHLIVVERSPLLETVNEVSLEDYYTTEIPGTVAFPKNDDNVDLKTFVNFKNATTRIYKERAETLNGEIKTFDKLLNARILEKLLASQDVSFNDEALQEAVEYYIYVTRRNNTFNDNLSYQQSWENYLNTLEFQLYQRQRLISNVCAEEFLNANTSVEFEVGGTCYVK
jgi:hypothetical protein